MIGKEIGGYRIVEKMGEGGMGVVYKAIETQLDRVVAIKALHPQFSGNAELLERFRAEARAHAQMNHPNIAMLYTFLVQEGVAYMVMEFVEGETFDRIVRRRGPIPAAEVLPLFRQALAGIGYAHRLGIVHRDIKPSNIMLSREGIVKVMDFGLAKVLGDPHLTGSGVRLGTVYYMSPEQVLNKPVDIRSDVYSLGATLFEILTAQAPFQGESDFHILSAHVNSPPSLPSCVHPHIPGAVETAVLKALAKNPEDRFQTVEEFSAALEPPGGWDASAAPTAEFASPPGLRTADVTEVVTTVTRSARRPRPDPAVRRRRMVRAGSVTAAALLAGWLIFRPSPGPPGAPPASAPPAQPAVVRSVTIPARTAISVRTVDPVDGKADRVGQEFEGRVAVPVTVEDQEAIQAGDRARLRLEETAAARRSRKRELILALVAVTAGGRSYDVSAVPYLVKGSFFHRKRVAAGTLIEFTLSAPVTVTLQP